MTNPSGYPANSNDPYGSAGQYPTGGAQGFQPPGSYPPPGQQPGYQQASYPGSDQYSHYGQYGQYPGGNAAYPAPNTYGQPAYGQPGYGAPAGSARPGMVTAAAVLAFIWGGLGILFGFLGLVAGSVLSSASSAVCDDTSLSASSSAACKSVSGIGTFLIIITIGLIVVAGLMIWGGVVALNGKNGQILVIACAVYAALALLSVFGSGFEFTSLLGFVIPVLILVFMFNTASRAWFRAKGGKTF
jgi:hypothetical protein